MVKTLGLYGKIVCPNSEELLKLDHAYLCIHVKALYQDQVYIRSEEYGCFNFSQY